MNSTTRRQLYNQTYRDKQKMIRINAIIDLARKITAEGGGNIKFVPEKPPYMKNASEMQEDLRK